MLSELNIPQIITITATVGGLVFGIVKYIISGMSILFTGKFSQLEIKLVDIEKNQKEISKDLNDFKLDVISRYLNRAEFEAAERNNSASHATVHGRMDDMNQRVTVIETIQKQCKGCNS